MTTILERDMVDALPKNPPVLTVEFSSSGPLCVLTLSGELIETSIPALEAQIDQISGAEFANVVLDVTALHRVDSVGLRVLIRLDTYVEAIGARLTIAGVSGQVGDALAHTHLVILHVPARGDFI